VKEKGVVLDGETASGTTRGAPLIGGVSIPQFTRDEPSFICNAALLWLYAMTSIFSVSPSLDLGYIFCSSGLSKNPYNNTLIWSYNVPISFDNACIRVNTFAIFECDPPVHKQQSGDGQRQPAEYSKQ
jgi:hypothetical protein